MVYTADELNLDSNDLDPDAVKVVRRLRRHGYDSYIVGGAVRDLLLGKHPKDFDVSTAATPNQIRKLFRNSRIIGKRFRLAHLLFRDKIIEVSTFRSRDAEGFKNVYGTLEEDVLRRDFTANALFLNPEDVSVVDFVGGVHDIRKHVLKPVIPLDRIFREDPVRMIRAIKYAAAGGFKIPWNVRRRIKHDAEALEETPSSRMTEELFKILNTGYAAPIVEMLFRYGLYGAVVPMQAQLARSRNGYRQKLFDRLKLLDAKRAEFGPLERADLLVFLMSDYLLEYGPFSDQRRIPFRDAYFALKEFLSPVTPPNREVEQAINEIFRNKGRLLRDEPPEHLDPTQKKRRRRRRRRKRSSESADAGDRGADQT
jgi:poly(A) polymerase